MSSTKPQMSPASKPYFQALDGFRGLFALFVAIHHTTWYSYANYGSFINEAFVIIDLFFALSGFLMFYLYKNSLNSPLAVTTFLKKRVARLYPLHLFMLFVFIAFAFARILAHEFGLAAYEEGETLPFHKGADESWRSIFYHLTLTHSIGLQNSLTFNYPSWTISTEFFTYIFFAALMLWARPSKSWHYGLITMGIIFIFGVLSFVKPNMDITYDLGMLRCLAGFFIGGVAAHVFREITTRKDIMSLKEKKSFKLGFTVLEALTLIACYIFVTYCTGSLQFFAAPFLFVFICVFAFDGGYISNFMSQKIFGYLAKISYSVYMTHVIFAIIFAILYERLLPGLMQTPEEFTGGLNGDILLIPYMLTVIGFSHLTWRFVEIPGGRFLRNLNLGISKRVSMPL